MQNKLEVLAASLVLLLMPPGAAPPPPAPTLQAWRTLWRQVDPPNHRILLQHLSQLLRLLRQGQQGGRAEPVER